MQNYRNLIGPISIISIAYLMSKIFGFIREVLLANWTGVSSASDTLDLAFVIPDFLFYLSAGGYLAITLIPLMSNFEKEDEDKLNKYFLSLLNGLTLIFLILSILGFIFRYQIADIFGVLNQDLFVKVFTPIIFSQVFFFSGAIMMAYQYFKNEFKYAAIAPVIYNLSIILFGWIYSSTPETTVYGFAIGGLIGSFVGHIVVQLIGLKNVGLSYRFIKPKTMFLNQYFKVSLPLIVGQSIAVMDEQLFRIFGSFLSIGAIASFRYARRVAILPVGVLAQAVGVASFPTLSNLFVNKKFEELRELIRRQISTLFFLNVAIVLFFFFGSEEVVSIVYERGAFTSNDVQRVSSIMSVVSFAILPWSINQIVTRSFYVQSKYWYPVLIGTSATVLSTLLVLNSTNNSESNYAVLIVIPLFLYSMVLLFTLKIGNEKILNRDLAIDLSMSTLIGGVVFSFIRFLSVSGNSNIMNLLIYLTIIALAFIVSLNVIKMKYIKVKKE